MIVIKGVGLNVSLYIHSFNITWLLWFITVNIHKTTRYDGLYHSYKFLLLLYVIVVVFTHHNRCRGVHNLRMLLTKSCVTKAKNLYYYKYRSLN